MSDSLNTATLFRLQEKLGRCLDDLQTMQTMLSNGEDKAGLLEEIRQRETDLVGIGYQIKAEAQIAKCEGIADSLELSTNTEILSGGARAND